MPNLRSVNSLSQFAFYAAAFTFPSMHIMCGIAVGKVGAEKIEREDGSTVVLLNLKYGNLLHFHFLCEVEKNL